MAVFRVDKTSDFTVMTNHHLRSTSLSLKAKGLQSLMLSLPESWDYTTKGLAAICKDGIDSIKSTLCELEQYGYLSRRRLRDEHGRLTDIEYTIHEQPITQETQNPTSLSPKVENPVVDNPIMDNPRKVSPVVENPTQSNTNISNTYGNQTCTPSMTNLSIKPAATRYDGQEAHLPLSSGCTRADEIDGMNMIDMYRERIMDNIDYCTLVDQYGKERMEGVVELILDAVCSKQSYIRVAGDEYPHEIVKSRFMKLSSSHIEYAFDCIDKNTSKIRNIKAYMLTTLYNASMTMDSYYRTEVNHALYGS